MRITVEIEKVFYPIRGEFRISRGAKTFVEAIQVRLCAQGSVGRGECVPYAHYGETVERVFQDFQNLFKVSPSFLEEDFFSKWRELNTYSARNGFECAFLDLRSKISSLPVWSQLQLPQWGPQRTAYTISLNTPEKMGQSAFRNRDWPLLKIKLGGDGDRERLLAVRDYAPQARLIVDVNEGWSRKTCLELCAFCANQGVELIEQPVKSEDEAVLRERDLRVLICADESFSKGRALEDLCPFYDAVTLKLDKSGGLRPLLQEREQAHQFGLKVMVGCMLGSSLAMAPAFLAAQTADYVDLDGPLLLEEDCLWPFVYEDGLMLPPTSELWG